MASHSNADEPYPDENEMTLRDYFAAKALPLAYKFWMEDYYHPDNEDAGNRTCPRGDFPQIYSLIADSAYGMADAMLEARLA
jgi:hypothetical protein